MCGFSRIILTDTMQKMKAYRRMINFFNALVVKIYGKDVRCIK